jgi:hypothetical protein
LFEHCEAILVQLPLLQTGMSLKPGVGLQVATPHEASSGRFSTHSPPAPHCLHAPQLATLQQTPSVQSLLAHASWLVPHGSPRGRLEVHFPPMHCAPPVQSAEVAAHFVLHATPLGSHWYPPHCCWLAAQAPLASQAESVNVEPTHAATAHSLPSFAPNVQAPFPSQLPAHAGLLPAHSLSGS